MPNCPFDSKEMLRMDDSDLVKLLAGSVPLLNKFMTGNTQTRVKGFVCPDCGNIALFKKKGGEP